MLETALAQLRFAASMLFGLPLSVGALERLVDAALATRREFGAIGPAAAEFLEGPALDEDTRRDMQLRRFRSQAVAASQETVYYAGLFEQAGLDPQRLRYEDIAAIPVTPKEAMRNTPDAFVRRSALPAFRTMTTGTTGKPTSTYFSAHEMQTTALLSAISFLQEGQIGPEDIVQISTSARATLGNTCFSQACQRIAAVWYLAGLVQPAQALALLAEEHHLPGKKPRASFLNTYPSYLGELVECGLAADYRPVDFGLERISVGGEVVTAGLKARAQQLFGAVTFIEGFGMTEVWPLGAIRCAAGHLHWEPSHGLVEVLSLETSGPAAPGKAGSLVATPFAPYRDAGVVLRYNTEDVVAPLAGPCTCRWRAWPATSDIQGKLRLSVRHDLGWTYPRDVLEALEAVEDVPLPARCGFWAVSGGVAVEAVVRSATPLARRRIEAALEGQGVPLRALHLVEDRRHLQHPLPLRCDLREDSFASSQPPAAADIRAAGRISAERS
jgi:phenylacetate-CoA ligase